MKLCLTKAIAGAGGTAAAATAASSGYCDEMPVPVQAAAGVGRYGVGRGKAGGAATTNH
jgi:hypothetical protein